MGFFKSTPRTYIEIGAVVVVAAILFFGSGGSSGVSKLIPSFSNHANTPVETPSGTLLLSIGAISTSTGDSLGTIPMTLTVSDGIKIKPFETTADSKGYTVHHAISANGNYGVFLGVAPSDIGSNKDTIGVAIYRADLQGKVVYADIMKAFENATFLVTPTSKDYHRENPVISSDGSILYSSLSESSYKVNNNAFATLPAEKWSIFEADLKGDAHFVTDGVRPKWIDTTHFAFLKNDGIYLYDLTSNTNKKVWGSSETLTNVQGFDISDDGQLMAFSEPAKNIVTIMHVNDWNTGSFTTIAELSVPASNLVFSPDDSYLAMIALREEGPDSTVLVPGIEYYSITNLRFVDPTVRFDATTVNSIYITDWR